MEEGIIYFITTASRCLVVSLNYSAYKYQNNMYILIKPAIICSCLYLIANQCRIKYIGPLGLGLKALGYICFFSEVVNYKKELSFILLVK